MTKRQSSTKPSAHEISDAVAVAAGRAPGSLLLRDARVLNVFTNEIMPADVLLAGRLIAAVGPNLLEQVSLTSAGRPAEIVELHGAYLAPGLIDGHLHLESSLVMPANYARAVLPRGVTVVVCDPHEVANVAGEQGVQWLLEASEGLALDVYVTIPSCVPSTPNETAGAELPLEAMERLLQHPRVVGVAEVMSFPAVIAGEGAVLAKVSLAERAGLVAEGHAPALSGHRLQAYVAAGISSDHESTTLEEGREKLRAGLFLMVREGSLARDLAAQLPLLEPRHGDRIGFVTDDKLPHDLLTEGGVDHLVREAIRAGVDPVYAVRCASLNNALHYRLARRGAVAAGYFADLVVLDDLNDFAATAVYKNGRSIVDLEIGGTAAANSMDHAVVKDTVHLPPLVEASFAIPLSAPVSAQLPERALRARCVGVVAGQIVTKALEIAPRIEGAAIIADVQRDLLKLACVERHGHGGRVGVGLVNGFGLQRGALATSVGHDHHNLMVVGANDADMVFACQRLREMGGGFVAAAAGEVLAELALPVAGLLSDAPLDEVAAALDRLDLAAAELGNRLPSPFMALTFLGLPVIPELKVTDHGVVDVANGRVVSTVVEA